MPATEASELLARFAAGAAPADVCTPQGRALLRGAVRAYGAEMARAGVPWPVAPATAADRPASDLNSVDATVLVALAAGFVEASDFCGAAQERLARLSFAHWPELDNMRQAARVACVEVAALQHAAARLVLEAERYQRLSREAQKHRSAGRENEHLTRQARRLERAHVAMQFAAAVVHARLDAASSNS